MARWAQRLGRHGKVHAFDYPYMAAGKRRPDLLPKLIEAHKQAIDAAKPKAAPLVLAGKSMGGRVGCHVATEIPEQVRALICFGYPLVGMGKTRKRRDQVLRDLSVPILFIQGDRDTLCPVPELEEVRREMSAASELYLIDGGNHSLAVGKRALKARGQTQDDVDDAMEESIAQFLKRYCAS